MRGEAHVSRHGPFRDAYSTNCPSKHNLTLFSFPPYSSKLWTSIFKIGSQFLCRFIREMLSVCVGGGGGAGEGVAET